MTNKLQPPQPAPVWNHTPASVQSEVNELITAARTAYDKIAALPKSERTFATVFGALAEAEANAGNELMTFYQHVSPDSALRDASAEADEAIRDFDIEREMRVDLFEAAKDARASANDLSDEDERFVEKILLEGKRAGLDLAEPERKELETLKKELAGLCVQFQRNCGEEKGRIAFTVEELDGIPEDVLSGYTKRDDGKLELTFKNPDIMPLFRYAKIQGTRRTAWEAYESRVSKNTEVFEKVLETRRKIAALLKYPTWADYITEIKMVKNAKGVIDFIVDVESKLRPVGERHRQELLALKKQEEADADGNFYVWDWYFYDRLHVERTMDLDDVLVKEYFPVDVVVPTILKIYQDLLGVEFVPLSNDVEKGDVWDPDVQRFAVWEAGATDASGFVGYTYLDLYPREGKFPHAAVFPLLPGYELRDGTRKYPVAAIVANLAKPTPDRPALMTHSSVVTFFHEMGHVFHVLLSKTKYSRLHGTNAVSRDFVEAPSQMLENWCWVPKVLTRMSSHYKTKEPLSDELIDKIIKSRYVNIGMYMLRQIFLGKYDIIVHTSQAGEDYTKLWAKVREETSLVKGPAQDAPGQSTFAHLVGEYDAGYYGYAYSLVFAADMYRTVFAKDPLSPVAGKKYRDEILTPGGSRDDMDSLKAFLGRPPSADAFALQLLGTTGTPAAPQ